MISVSVTSGHLSSASIYPACFAPYHFVTACSDGEVRFWHCTMLGTGQTGETSTSSVTSYEFSMEEGNIRGQPQVNSRREERKKEFSYSWSEWERPSSSRDKSSSVSLQGMLFSFRTHIIHYIYDYFHNIFFNDLIKSQTQKTSYNLILNVLNL